MTLEEVQQIIPESEAWKLQPGTYVIAYDKHRISRTMLQQTLEWFKDHDIDALLIGIEDGVLKFYRIGES